MVTAPADVTLVVASIGDAERLGRCVDRALRSTGDPSLSVAVVVALDGVDEEARRRALDVVPAATVLAWPERRGFAAALNAGFRAARTDVVAILQDDTVAEEGWLASLVRTAARYQRAGVIGSCLRSPDGAVLSAGWLIGPDGGTAPMAVAGLAYGADADPREAVSSVDYVSSAALLVRRAAWADAGGFDEELYPLQYVDADFATAVWSAGWQVLRDLRSVVVHELHGSSPSPLRMFAWQRNRARFVAKWADRLAGRPAWSAPPVASDIATATARVVRWLTDPPAPAPDTPRGAPEESPAEVYRCRERVVTREYVAYLEALVAGAADLEADLRAAIADADARTAELHRRVAECDVAQRERDRVIEVLQAQVAGAAAELERIRHTVSWRVTAPLRWVRRGGRGQPGDGSP